MISNKAFVLLAFLLCPMIAAAQENNSSPYSCIGIGDLNNAESVRTAGMASTAIGISGRTFLNTANPASLAALDTNLFILDLTGSARGSHFTSGTADQKTFGANFTRVTAGLRLTPRWSAAMSMQPYSTVSYRSEYEEYIEGSEMTTQTLYEGSGGVTRFSCINSFAITESLSLGADVMLLLGNIDHNVSQGGITVNQNSAALAVSFLAGLLYKDKLTGNMMFSAGLTYGRSGEMKLKNNILIQDASGNTVLDEAIASSSTGIPDNFGAGLSVTGRRILIAADYSFQRWSVIKDQMPAFRFTDRHEISAGIAFVPSPTASMYYLRKVEYQAGFSVSNSYLRYKDTNPLNIEITSGFCLPLRNGSNIGVGLSLGRQGTVSEGLVRENYVKLTLGLSLAERMFLKRMYD